MYKHNKIPERLYDILEQDETWLAKTQMAIQRIGIYLYESEMFFFPEYTNHRISHVENILSIIEKLLPYGTIDILSPKDISCLILSVYLHDIGMFLKPEGLHHILLDETWKQRFKSFIKVISRMSDIELKKIYGDSSLFIYPTDLDNHLNMSNRDKLTYGEFLRRNHGDIAEYITINGFPGYNNIDLLEEFDEEHKKLIGLIAKSHCMTLRLAAEESNNNLIGKKNTYRPSNVPIVYLMILLRIGDILDMGKDRSPHILYDMQQFYSAISKEEWQWNQTIDSSNFNWKIAKTLYIQSEPKNTAQFIKVEKNLKWFQQELDFSWAALCDYYGNEFNLTIHRIESNIFEQPELFKNKFLTKEAKIKITSNLTKLLVEPLYHGNPCYAVRELLQNSMDACNMRKKNENKKGEQFKGKIEVNIDTRNMIFSIKDNGIGMDEDVIVNYYLTVGSNFRNSDYWKNALTDNDDESKIIRSGRFGVGFLATFLLGKEITVTTRHVDDTMGYRFSVTLDDEYINPERIKGVEIGTEIKVTMSQEITKFWEKESFRFTWRKQFFDQKIVWNEWYHAVNPGVTYLIDDNVVEQELNYKIPSDKDERDNWRNLESRFFDKVSYGFISVPDSCITETSFLGDCNLLSNVILNGFLISENITFKEVWGVPGNIVICSIVDDKNLLQLDLSRTNLDYRHEIFDLINIEIWKWQLAQILCCNVPLIKREKGKKQKLFKYKFGEDIPDGILYKKDCFSFLHPYFIKKLSLEKFYMLKKPIDDSKRNVNIMANILDSGLPLLIYSNEKFKDEYIKTYGKINSKYDHLFELVDFKNVNLKYNSVFTKLIDDIFSDVTDLWIPFDFNERKNKFKKAFCILSEYVLERKMVLNDKNTKKEMKFPVIFNNKNERYERRAVSIDDFILTMLEVDWCKGNE